MRIVLQIAAILTTILLVFLVYEVSWNLGWKFDLGLVLGLGIMYVYHRIRYGFWMDYGN